MRKKIRPLGALFLCFDFACFVKCGQGGELFDGAFCFFAAIGVFDEAPVFVFRDESQGGGNVLVVGDAPRFVFHGAVGGEEDAVGIGDEGVARRARGLSVGVGEAAVDDQDLSLGFHRLFAFFPLHRRVAVNDFASSRVDVKGAENLFREIHFLPQAVVGIFFLFVGGFIINKVAFEGGDPLLAEKGRGFAAPQVKHEIRRLSLFFASAEEAVPHHGIESIEKFSAGQGLA